MRRPLSEYIFSMPERRDMKLAGLCDKQGQLFWLSGLPPSPHLINLVERAKKTNDPERLRGLLRAIDREYRRSLKYNILQSKSTWEWERRGYTRSLKRESLADARERLFQMRFRAWLRSLTQPRSIKSDA